MAPYLLEKRIMNTRTIILASLSLFLAVPGNVWAGPLTPEHAWRQMQGAGSRPRVTMPRNRPLYSTPQVNHTRTTTKTHTTVQPKQATPQPAQKTTSAKGQGWLSKLTGKLKRKAPQEKAQSAEADKATPKRSHNVGLAMGLARVKLTSLWSGMVGGLRNVIAWHKQRQEARDVAFNTLYWRQPMIVPAGQPIPAEMLMGGMRLHKLQNYSQGTLGMLHRSGLVTATEYRILTEARMGLPRMMQGMQQAPEGGQPAPPQSEAPQMPPPPQQQ